MKTLVADRPKGGQWKGPPEGFEVDFDGPRERAFEPFAEAWRDRPILARFQEIVARHGDNIAVDDGVVRLTYAQCWAVIARLARQIVDRVPPGRPVGILLPNGALFPVAALACFGAGRPYVPIDRNYPARYNRQVLREAGLAALIVDGSDPPAFDIPPTLPIVDIAEARSGSAVPPIDIAVPNGPAIILYTSGSTGRPKGICNDQRAILQRVADSTNTFHVSAEDRFILVGSPGTIAGVRDTYTALLNGATLRIADPLRVGIGGALQVLRDERITICYAVPALWRLLLSSPLAREAVAHLRIAQMAGDNPLDSDIALCRDVLPSSCRIMVRYGSTEVPTVFQWFVPRDWRADKPRIPIGYPRPDVDFRLLGDDEEQVAAGEAGELVVRSRYLALGYWQDGKLEPGPFLPDPEDPRARIMRTGDLIRLRADGLAEMLGRKDRQIKIRGLRVDLGQIEAALRDCGSVADAAVIARRQDGEVGALIAFVVPRDPEDARLVDGVREALAARLPRHMRPAHIRRIDAIPRLPSFKSDLKTLEEIDRREATEEEGSTPKSAPNTVAKSAVPPSPPGSSGVDKIVERAWTNLLGSRSFEADTSWDDAGGDSLKALQLWFQLERDLGQKLPLDVLHENATPRSLVAALAALIRAGDGHRMPPAAGGDTPVIFLMPGIAGDEPLLAQFRSQFVGKIRFEVIDYPAWRDMIEGGASLAAIIDAVVSQLRAIMPKGPYALAGYSFGGFIAFETARRLIEEGDRIRLLALIDSRESGVAETGHARRVGNLLARPQRLMPALLRRFITLCVRMRWFGLLRAMGERVIASRSDFAFYFRYHLTWMLRVLALRGWRPRPIPVRAVLFRSDDELPGTEKDLGWGALCEQLDVVAVGGTHASMLEPPHVDRLRDEILRALAVLPAEPRSVATDARRLSHPVTEP